MFSYRDFYSDPAMLHRPTSYVGAVAPADVEAARAAIAAAGLSPAPVAPSLARIETMGVGRAAFDMLPLDVVLDGADHLKKSYSTLQKKLGGVGGGRVRVEELSHHLGQRHLGQEGVHARVNGQLVIAVAGSAPREEQQRAVEEGGHRYVY